MFQKLSDGAATERLVACDVADGMSAVSGTIKSLCDAGVAIAVSVAAVTSEKLLELKFLVQSLATARPLHFKYDTRRLPYVGDPRRVDNGYDQPSGYGLAVRKIALRGTRLG